MTLSIKNLKKRNKKQTKKRNKKQTKQQRQRGVGVGGGSLEEEMGGWAGLAGVKGRDLSEDLNLCPFYDT